MKKRNGKFNDKRKMLNLEECDFQHLSDLASKAKYGGNPEHKRNPGDFNLTPPSSPRKKKSLCDSVKVFTRKEALALLRKGIKMGLVSDRSTGFWPKNVWSIMDDGTPLEAQLESSEQGSYHGYPMQKTDPFYEEVIKQWRIRSEKAKS
ncbi:hypothetical protein PN471_18490 [Aphanizomenon sp. CS-733/32]|uniref:hypothetical protein n=1 Tax=Aphanizomenon sp. CS-733/32 TaxID=3021715 RepID=UPI00232F2D06|nr:hypothetical protein [Aphanizomenon sp. CS-733/32]MDB9310574.1 hypothetical protein [Aphanizomenon sp. CS-733/32]